MTADAVGGVWQYSADLSRKLTEHGYDVLLAVLGPAPSHEQLQQLGHLSRDRIVAREFALEWMTDPWADVDRSRDWLLELEDCFRPLVIHLNGYALADAPWHAPVISVAHSCVCSWWEAVHGCTPDPQWNEYVNRVSQGIASAAKIVAPSRFMAAEISRLYRVSADKISHIPNFSLAPALTRREKRPLVLAAGRMWDQAKNLALLHSIAGDIAWPLLIAGSDPTHASHSPSSPILLGRLSHRALLEHIADTGIFAHPALYEPFGLVVLEAARAGCCLVLSDIPPLRELWGGAALLLDPHDPGKWSSELNKLIGDPGERARLGAAALARSAQYNADSSVRAYLGLYDSLQTRSQSPSGAAA